VDGDLWRMGTAELVACYRRREASPGEVVEALAGRVEALDRKVGAFTTKLFEEARREAAERERSADRDAPLYGVPVAVKELFDVAGAETTWGSSMLAGRVPSGDAETVARLRRAGAIVLGLTRSHEFAWGITTRSERGGTRNPWDDGRIAGGSSGGAAAAVAAGLVPAALGSDTGGSIRIPAAFCGIAGFKPTYGAVPVDGVCPLAPSLDHAGPLARRARDLVSLTEVLSGRPLKIGMEGPPRFVVSRDLHVVAPAPDRERAFEDVVRAVTAAGASVVERRFPGAAAIYDTFARIQLFEAIAVHRDRLALYPARREEYSAGVAARLALAERVTEDDYEAAGRERRAVRARFAELLASARILLTPVSATAPSTVQRPDVVDHLGAELPLREAVMHYTVPQNVAGLPACVVWSGKDGVGLPVGIQLTAAAGEDAACLAAACWLEDVLGAPEWPPVALGH
jgi:aspartyl-tRNA(Asn)/glutamyl-tRNA(Gln) amidotransferase subunit A